MKTIQAMAKTVRAVDVSRFILEESGAMEQLKLQKLLYYCQALCLVRHGIELFADPIEAWVNGPVVRDIWDRHQYEYRIECEPEGNSAALDEDDRSVVRSILETYGKYDAWELVRWVHRDQPWIDARAGLGPKERGHCEIDTGKMQSFYLQKWSY